MTWGINNKTFKLYNNVNILNNKTLIIASGWYIHDMNGHWIKGGAVNIFGNIIPYQMSGGYISYDNTPDYWEWVHFTANVTDDAGRDNYTYQWYRAPVVGDQPGSWEELGTTQTIYLKCTIWPFFLKCLIDDNNGLNEETIITQYGNFEKKPPEISLPNDFNLFQNHPNPFNPETTLKFAVPENVSVTLNIYDITGKLVRNLVNETKRRGFHNVEWDGKDYNGNKVSSGVYIYKLRAGSFIDSKKMTLLK